MAQGPRTFLLNRNKRIPVFSRGRCPRAPAIPGFCALFVRSPRRAGGLFALSALRCARATRAGRFAPSPLRGSPPCARARCGPSRVRPLRPWRWGGGVLGSLPSLSPAPCGPSAAPCGGGWVAPFVRCRLLWGCVVVASSFVPSASSVLRSARFGLAPWAGSALGVSFRPSARALSGVVAVVRFSSASAAARFARSWGARLPAACRGCVVRPAPAGAGVAPSWCVSVPVAPPPAPVRRGGASRALAAVFAARCGAGA